MSGGGSGSGNAVVMVSAPAGAVPPDPNDRVFGPLCVNSDFELAVSARIAGDVDLSTDGIPTPPTDETIAAASFLVGLDETSGEWQRGRMRELIEGAGWPTWSLAAQALPFVYDDVQDDFYIARGRVGVQDVRLARMWGTPTQLATSFADLAAGEFRRLVAVAPAAGLLVDLLTFSSTSSTRWFQLWDLASTAAVPTSRTVGARPIVQVAIGVGQASAIAIPSGGLPITNGIVIVASTVPDYYSAPAAGDQDDLAFTVEYATRYNPG